MSQHQVSVRYRSPPAVIDSVDGALVMVENAFVALSAAVEFQATRQIRNFAVAATAFAREAKDTRLLDKATELRTRAERKAGQMLDESEAKGERAKRGNAPGTNGRNVARDDVTHAPTLAEIGVTRDQSSKWQQVAALSDDEFEDALATTKSITHEISTPKVLRAVQQARSRSAPLVDSDEVAVLPPCKAPSPDEQASVLYDAVRALADITCSAQQLRAALPYYQHFRVTDNIGRALALLQEVHVTWKTSTTSSDGTMTATARHGVAAPTQPMI